MRAVSCLANPLFVVPISALYRNLHVNLLLISFHLLSIFTL